MLTLDSDMVSRFTVRNLHMNTHPKALAMNAPTQLTTHELQVKGMSCQHCVKAVTQAVLALDAQAQVGVDLPSGQVSVQTQLSREATAAAIADEGYTVVNP
ncbi:copper chaperone CopZ [Aquabacterium commune]|uniref:Copper chaperone CopZ n=2 Tax=Aquabacterium commune TaxID=70586 RepID=A0A4R6RP87_9BURK|nr:copper chaperone CopZ [Aquabacterium commune]